MEIKNAVIESVRFDTERGLMIWIMLSFGGSGQGFGGHMLYAPKGWAAHNTGADLTGHFIWRVLEIAGVSELSKLPGRTVRVKGDFSTIEAIGHIVKDEWFSPCAEFQALMAKFESKGAEAQLASALKDCVSVMDRDLKGLEVIQPELRRAQAALVAAGAA